MGVISRQKKTKAKLIKGRRMILKRQITRINKNRDALIKSRRRQTKRQIAAISLK